MNFRLLRADEIEARVSTVSDKGCSVLLYKNARCDMNILDETVGPTNWQRDHKDLKGNMYAGIGIRAEDGTWVWKWDCGTESYTEAEKGEASDSFKRAGFNWGIGRELYTSPFIWFPKDKVNIESRNGKPTTYDRFSVEEIEFTDRKVSWVKVMDTKTKEVFTWGKSTKLNDENSNDPLTEEQAEELHRYMVAADINEEKLLEKYKKEKLADFTMTQYTALKNKAEKAILDRVLKEVEA